MRADRAGSAVLIIAALAWIPAAWGRGKTESQKKTPLEEYLESVAAPQHAQDRRTPGSLWTPGAGLNDLGRDLRANRVDDLVTITVYESASAVSSGTSKTQRTSSARTSIDSIGGHSPRGLKPVIDVSSGTSLDGQGTTTRHNELSTTVSARVTQVLPNGNLVVEGIRQIGVNSEQQTITLRGILRPVDLNAENAVTSDRLALLEVRVNGKGVVADSIRRPNFLYRLLLGLLPF